MAYWIEVTVWQDGRTAGRMAWQSVFREDLRKEFPFSPEGHAEVLQYIHELQKESPEGIERYKIHTMSFNEQGRLFL